jgi:hypothetical protein
MKVAQNYLDSNYSPEERSKITNLNISNKGLEGNLNLDGFENLEELNCNDNKLVEVNLINNKKMVNLYCKNNQLTNLDLSGCENLQTLEAHNSRSSLEYFNELLDISFLNQLPNPEKLKSLCLSANGIHSDLTPFARFINLEDLDLGI